jgi:hypothetical protein
LVKDTALPAPRHRFETWNLKLLLRDGVIGNTSGFEPEDEGSIPSPAAKIFHSYADASSPISSGFPDGVTRPAVLRLVE